MRSHPNIFGNFWQNCNYTIARILHLKASNPCTTKLLGLGFSLKLAIAQQKREAR